MATSRNNTKIVWGVGTPRTLRAHWSMHELGLDYERRPIGSRNGGNLTPEYTRLNPSQKIPTLQDGDLVVSESAAIVNYLTTCYGAAKNLQPPAEPGERARYDVWCFFCMMELDADTMYIIRRHGDLHAIYGEAPNAVKAAKRNICQAGRHRNGAPRCRAICDGRTLHRRRHPAHHLPYRRAAARDHASQTPQRLSRAHHLTGALPAGDTEQSAARGVVGRPTVG
jgi:Glutathione S-transferase, N-terminal domain